MRRSLLIVAQVVLLALLGNSVMAGATQNSQGAATNLKPAQVEQTVTQVQPLTPVGSGFTYQGQLKQGGSPTNGQYDFVFTLYDALTGGNQVSQPVTQTNVTVTDGLFTVTLDFGAGAFNGDGRWLEIAVRQAGGGSYTTLSPRQPLTPAPYALFALKTQGYKNVVTVAKAGGDFTSVQAALDSITDNGASNRYLVWVGPGTYNEQVTMKSYVDIEGAGENVTKITYSGGSDFSGYTVFGAPNAEMRFLTVENTGGNTYAIGVREMSSLLHVTVTASGGTVYNYGVYNAAMMNNVAITASGGSLTYGVYHDISTITMNDVTITALNGTYNYGVYNLDAQPTTMKNVTLTASGGTSNTGVYSIDSPVTINYSDITGFPAIFNDDQQHIYVAASRLVSAHTGLLITCAGTYDANYTFYPTGCP